MRPLGKICVICFVTEELSLILCNNSKNVGVQTSNNFLSVEGKVSVTKKECLLLVAGLLLFFTSHSTQI